MTTEDMPRIRLWEAVDTDLLRFDSEECQAPKCSLWGDHYGPHADIHPISGRVFDTWGDGQDSILGPRDVSDEVLKVVKEINRYRDEALDAISAAEQIQTEVQLRYSSLSREQDPILYDLLRSRGFWPSEGRLQESGTENDHDKAIREELIEIFGDYERDEW